MDIEQKINKLEQELDWLKEQVKNCKPKYWEPENGEALWYIDGIKIYSGTLHGNNKFYNELQLIGNCFKTEEEARKELELRLATQRLKKAIWEANGGKFVNFSYNIKNTTINRYYNTLQISNWTEIQTVQDWMYIKDEKTAIKVLEENRRDFEIYYGLNK